MTRIIAASAVTCARAGAIRARIAADGPVDALQHLPEAGPNDDAQPDPDGQVALEEADRRRLARRLGIKNGAQAGVAGR